MESRTDANGSASKTWRPASNNKMGSRGESVKENLAEWRCVATRVRQALRRARATGPDISLDEKIATQDYIALVDAIKLPDAGLRGWQRLCPTCWSPGW